MLSGSASRIPIPGPVDDRLALGVRPHDPGGVQVDLALQEHPEGVDDQLPRLQRLAAGLDPGEDEEPAGLLSDVGGGVWCCRSVTPAHW
jgi:hypothetical protein